MELAIITILLFLFAFAYLKIADRYNIIDKPNERSSHQTPTIRGGGILFVFALLLYFIKSDFSNPYLVLAVILIGMISFIDDIKTLSSGFRLPFQFVAIFLVIGQLGFSSFAWWGIPILLVIGVGFINIYNFMDGINGITGLYSLAVLVGIYFVNDKVSIIPVELILYITSAVLVFGYFNFRKKALFFAGDIGSISIAILLFYMLLKLVYALKSPVLILLVAVYGVDAVITIFYRKLIGEKITQPHRYHIYQKFVDIKKTPHLKVAVVYMTLQLLLAVLVCKTFEKSLALQMGIVLVTLLLLSGLYYSLFLYLKPKKL